MQAPQYNRQVGATLTPTARFQPVEDQAGGIIGQAMQQAGATIFQRGQELKSKRDKTLAMQKANEFYKYRQDYMYNDQTGVMFKKGMTADGSYTQSLTDLQAKADELLAMAENEDQRLLLEDALNSDILQSSEEISRHEASEQQNISEAAFKNTLALAQDDFVISDDPTRAAAAVGVIRNALAANMGLDETDPEQKKILDQAMLLVVADLHTAKVTSLIDKDPYAALDWITKYGAEMDQTKLQALKAQAETKIDGIVRATGYDMEMALLPSVEAQFQNAKTDDVEKAIYEGKLPDGSPLLFNGRPLNTYQKERLFTAYQQKMAANGSEAKRQAALDEANTIAAGRSWRDQENVIAEVSEKYAGDVQTRDLVLGYLKELYQIQQDRDVRAFVDDGSRRLATNFNYTKRSDGYAEIARMKALPENADRSDAEWSALTKAYDAELAQQESQGNEVQQDVQMRIYNDMHPWHISPNTSLSYKNMVARINNATYIDPATGKATPLDQNFKDFLLSQAAQEWGISTGTGGISLGESNDYLNIYEKLVAVSGNGVPAILNECPTYADFIKRYGTVLSKMSASRREGLVKEYMRLKEGRTTIQTTPGNSGMASSEVINRACLLVGITDSTEKALMYEWINTVKPSVEKQLGHVLSPQEIRNLVFQGAQEQTYVSGHAWYSESVKKKKTDEIYDIMFAPGVSFDYDKTGQRWIITTPEGAVFYWSVDLLGLGNAAIPSKK